MTAPPKNNLEEQMAILTRNIKLKTMLKRKRVSDPVFSAPKRTSPASLLSTSVPIRSPDRSDVIRESNKTTSSNVINLSDDDDFLSPKSSKLVKNKRSTPTEASHVITEACDSTSSNVINLSDDDDFLSPKSSKLAKNKPTPTVEKSLFDSFKPKPDSKINKLRDQKENKFNMTFDTDNEGDLFGTPSPVKVKPEHNSSRSSFKETVEQFGLLSKIKFEQKAVDEKPNLRFLASPEKIVDVKPNLSKLLASPEKATGVMMKVQHTKGVKIIPKTNIKIKLEISDKQGIMYTEILKSLKLKSEELYGITLSPREVITDFEIPLRKAIKAVWVTAKLGGCYFHYRQCTLRKVRELGLIRRYNRRGSELKKLVAMLDAIAFLPVDQVAPVFEEIKIITAHADRNVQKLISYKQRVWIGSYVGRQLVI